MTDPIQVAGRDLATDNFWDISIPLRFDEPQPNAYGVAQASAVAYRSGELIGDTRQGGSCNFEQYTFIPHCNGTHTECVGHITNERISVRQCLKDVFMPARLISVEPEPLDGDLLITTGSLERSSGFVQHEELPATTFGTNKALIVRTLPNDESKLTRIYDGDLIPPYFASDVMELIVVRGFRHLLVDLPSIDRLFDDGKLANHRIFWNVEPGSLGINAKTRINSTITELIYVSNEVPDGQYLLNLQIAPFDSDAAPSRPILFPFT